MSQEQISVLFCCLGNICRSPMAEAVFKEYTKDYPQFIVQSAGTAGKLLFQLCIVIYRKTGYHIGDSPDPRTLWKLKENGIYTNSTAQQIQSRHFKECDWILCMDNDNLNDLLRLSKKVKNCKAQIKLFGEFDEMGETIIKDPYYGDTDGFSGNFDQVNRCSVGFLKSLGFDVVKKS